MSATAVIILRARQSKGDMKGNHLVEGRVAFAANDFTLVGVVSLVSSGLAAAAALTNDACRRRRGVTFIGSSIVETGIGNPGIITCMHMFGIITKVCF
jgi:hypothetical protein